MLARVNILLDQWSFKMYQQQQWFQSTRGHCVSQNVGNSVSEITLDFLWTHE